MRFIPALCAVLILTLPAAAHADALLDRYRVANERMGGAMAAFMISRVPELESVIPSPAWTDENVTAGICMMDTIRADRGEDGLEAYVAAVEEMSAVEVTSLLSMGEGAPALLNDIYFFEVAQACGSWDLAFRQAEESGLADMVARPEIAEALNAE